MHRLHGLTAVILTATFFARQSMAGSPIHWTPMGEPGSGGTVVDVSVDPGNSSRLLISGDMLGVGRSVDGGKSWQAATGFSCFEDGSFTWHPTEPDTVWVGTMSGPYLSRDGGSTWTARREGMPAPAGFGRSAPVEKVLYDPDDVHHLLAIGGSSRHWDCGPHPAWGAIWESTDDGDHWKKLTTLTATGSSDAPGAKGVNLWQAVWLPQTRMAQPGYIYGVADSAGLVLSRDRGKSWQVIKTTGLPGIGRLAITADEKMWMSVGNTGGQPGGVYKSQDDGHTWTPCSTGLARTDGGGDNLVSRYDAICVSPADPRRLFVCDTAWNAGVIYRSTDGGDHWTAAAKKNNVGQANPVNPAFNPTTAFPAGLSITGATFDPRDPETAYFWNTEFVLATHDGGKSFQDITSDRAGEGFRGRGFCGICTEHFGFNPYQKGQSIAQGMDAARAWISDDDLHSWRYPLTTPDPWFGGEDCSFAKDGHIFVNCGQYGFHGVDWSADGGKTWRQNGDASGLPPIRTGGGRESQGIDVDPDDSRLVWAVAEGRLFHTTDGGDHWHPIRTGSVCHFIAADPAAPGVVYVTSDKNLYRVDPDDTVTPLGGPHPGGRIHFAAGSLFVASYEGDRGGLWKFDRLKNWQRLRDDRQIMDVAVDPVDPKRLAVATNMMPYADIQQATGVWVSDDAGKTWSQQNDGLAMTRGGAIAFDPFDHTRLVFGTFGRGYFVAHWPADDHPVGTASYLSTPADAAYARVDESDGKPKTVALINGDMSAGTAVPTAWDGKWGDVTVARDTDVFASAPASLRVSCPAGKQGQASQSFDVTGGQTITVAGKFKTAGHAKVNFAVQSYDTNWRPIGFVQIGFAQNDSDWTAAKKSVELPADAAHAAVVLLVEGDGRAWLDDVTAR